MVSYRLQKTSNSIIQKVPLPELRHKLGTSGTEVIRDPGAVANGIRRDTGTGPLVRVTLIVGKEDVLGVLRRSFSSEVPLDDQV